MLKILQARLQQYVNFQMSKLDLEKAEEPEIKLPTSAGSSEKQESSRKTSTSALLTMPKPLTVWITTKCGKLSSGHRTGKGQFSFQSQRKAMPKNAQTITQLH